METCAARARLRRRGLARQAGGRPATSSIAPADLTEKAACVIGADEGAVTRVEQMLALTMGVEVDRLGLTTRDVDRVWKRDYGLVLYDATPGDPIALMNQLSRGLAASRRRGTLIVVCHDADSYGPALEDLTTALDAIRLRRPVHPMAILDATGLSGAPVASLAG